MKFIYENWSAILFTLFVHTVVLALFAVNIDFNRQAVSLDKRVAIRAEMISGAVIDAEVKRQAKIDEDVLNAEIKRQKDLEDEVLQAEIARKAEEQRVLDLEQARQQQEAEALKQAELKKQADLEKKRLADLEAKRKSEEADLDKVKAEQLAVKKKAEEEKNKAAELVAKKKAEAEASKNAQVAAEALRVAQLEAELGAALADEENYNKAADENDLERYIKVLSQHIIRNWRRPPTAEEGLYCQLDVRQIPGGDVVSVAFVFCNGDQAVKDSIEQAVYRASPLPSPENRSVFNPDLTIDFKPEF